MKSQTKTKCNKLYLPRDYISWSQLSKWESNPEQYIREYIYHEQGFINDAMLFGGFIARELEKGSSRNEIVDTLIAVVPKYDKAEHKINVKLDNIPLFGVIDSYCPKSKSVIEYKTGIAPWTQTKANNHGQLHFYALMIWLKYKVIPKIKLVWIETERGDDIRVTGQVQEFEVKLTLKEILKMASRVKKVSEEISRAYYAEVN